MSRAHRESEIHASLGERLRKARRAAGLTQAELAELADRAFREREAHGEADLPRPTQGAVSAVENGQERAGAEWVQWLDEFAAAGGFPEDTSADLKPDTLVEELRRFDPHSAHQRDLISIGKQLLARGLAGDPVTPAEVAMWSQLARAEGLAVGVDAPESAGRP